MIEPLLRAFVPRFVRQRYLELRQRLDNVEAALDALIDSPRFALADAVGFNGQQARKAVFGQLLTACSFDALVETGTFLGDTTGYLAAVGRRPVYSCESNRRFHRLARQRLEAVPGITLVHGDSRDMLRELVQRGLGTSTVFFYLDAHFYAELPLVEELAVIGNHWSRAVVMIDDFQVEGDDGYGFDTYDRPLSLSLISGVVREHHLVPFFPSSRAHEETGARRGYVVLATQGEMEARVEGCRGLRRALNAARMADPA